MANERDSRADYYLKLQDRLKTQRGTFETVWTEIAERISTKDDDFLKEWQEGAKRTYHVFDSTAALALPKFAAALESILTPRTQMWHNLVPRDEDLFENDEVMRYLATVNKILFRARYAAGTNFSGQTQEVYRSLGAYGTGALFTDDTINNPNARRKGLRYKSIYLGELYILENADGKIDHVHRHYKLTAKQAAEQFGEDKLPEKIRAEARDHPEQKFEFLHVVCPNNERMPGMKTYRGMAFSSFDIAYEGRATLRESGYRTNPYAVSRYVTSSREVYGRSPAIDALPDIKMANAQKETLLRAGQLAVDPPTLLQDDGMLQPFQMRPGSLNYGMVNEDGKPMAIPMDFKSNMQLGMEMIDDTHRVLNESFLITFFQILVDNKTEMTATEVMQRAQEKGALLAPIAGRQQDELIAPIIEREIDVLYHQGQLPPMPRALAERGGEFDIAYSSPLARAQRAQEGVGLQNLMAILSPAAQINPQVFKRLNWDVIVPELATQIEGIPATWMYDDEQMAAIDQQQAQSAQVAQLAQVAPAASAAAANIAKIGAMQNQGGPGVGLPQLSAASAG